MQREFESPIGILILVGGELGLRGVLWPEHRHESGDIDPASDAASVGAARVLDAAERQLEEYFAGKRRVFDILTDVSGTPFQLQAWQQLSRIPFGETRTYGAQAAAMGNPAAVRAVGAANGRNPLPIIVPCHRVIGASGRLTGFAGGIEAKRHLLQFEASVAGNGALSLFA